VRKRTRLVKTVYYFGGRATQHNRGNVFKFIKIIKYMEKKTMEELNEEYELEIEKVVSKAKNNEVKRVLLQFPDGLKPYGLTIRDYLKEKTGKEYFIWSGSCFGACDLPNVREEDFDLIIQFGHSSWPYDKDEKNKNIEVIK